MFRPVIVSTAILFGLFLGADGAAGGSPNIPKTPKIMIPRPPAASRILVLPRTITVPRQDESTDDTNSKIDGSVTVTAPYTTVYDYDGEPEAETKPAETPVSGGQRPRLAPPAPSRPSTGVFKIPVPQQAK